MPTIQEEKRTKPRSRSRKADQRRSKSGQKQAEVRAEVESVSPMVAEPEVVEAEVAEVEVVETEAVAIEVAPVAVMEPVIAPEPVVATEHVVALEQPEPTALTGEVLPPEVLQPASHVDGFQAMAQAYSEYTKKSWLNGRFLMERLIAARTLDEAIEIQGEFTKQAYSNFLTQSQKMCGLYGAWTQQFFRPLVIRF